MRRARPASAFRRPGPSAGAKARHVALPRPMLIGAAGIGALLTAWAGASTWYILNSDVLTAQFFAKQTAMQYAYEEKVGALQAEIDRVTSQKLVEQNALDGRIAELAKKQALLEARQTVLSRLADEPGPTTTGSIALTPAAPQPEPFAGLMAFAPQPGKPSPVPEVSEMRMRDSLGTAPVTDVPPAGRRDRHSGLPARDQVALLDKSAVEIELAQLRSAHAVVRRVAQRASAVRSILSETGLDTAGLLPAPKVGVGGPLVAISSPSLANPLESVFAEAQSAVRALDQLRRVTTRLPLNRPTGGEPDLTSGFGVRLDPFTRGPAMHTGLDFRAESGAPVKATAPGRVLLAEYTGGYGNMVEVDHGRGVTTRYAHLSEISVGPGDRVTPSTVLGRVGSTGRSTGAHLHYETRIDGAPVDPQRFLRAGARLAMVETIDLDE